MTSVFRPNRKANDDELIKLNSLGLSLQTIAKKFGCHPSTVTQRLKDLGIPVADTRRAFMEDVYNSLSGPQQEFLSEKLGASTSVKEFVRKLIVEEFVRSQ
jgi:transcriptional regulator with XRE-family HTH domain